MGFVHLHLHTQYSLLDGANKVDALIPRVQELNMPAVAITDHGNMFGAAHFYKEAVDAGVQPILGCEVYVAPGDRREHRPFRADDYEASGNYHLILLAMNLDGYRNLCRLVTLAYQEGFYRKPRIDKELLREFNGGLIALSGCLASEVNRAIQAGAMDRARAVLEEYRALFDGRYYVEVQDNHLPEQERSNVELIRLAGELSLPVVATNDCHYLQSEDATAHEALLCIQTGKSLSDEKRFRFGTDQLYVKGAEEMRKAFPGCPEAIDNTLEVARRCEFELPMGTYQFPAFKTEDGISLEEQLDRDARAGLEQRLGVLRERPDWDDEKDRVYRERLAWELKTIVEMGFAGYFLIVADFTNYAKSEGIPVGPGRGSAAGSLVAYALRITELDPLPYGLLFERFLNPERHSMPDIDMDFCFERRDEVIRYVREKYGEDRVAQIITFGTLKGKAAIKDVGRVLDLSFGDTDRIAKLYPAPQKGKDFPLEAALGMEPRLRAERARGGTYAKLFDYALRLEGLMRHASRHAAGVVIGSRPLVEELPLFVDKDGAVLTQFTMKWVEKIGLIKFDFLGLKTLTLLENIVRMIRDGRGDEVDLHYLPLDDEETYRLISRGDTVGIFQMESGGMRKMLTQIRPTRFEHLIDILALYRPGPLESGMVEDYIRRKDGKDKVVYPHPALEEVLRETYGVIVYQEQVMQIARVLAGYSLGDADMLRRAMGKKQQSGMHAERDRFIAGARERGVPEAKAQEIFALMAKFADYGFNKSHSAAYALITYQTAYLKAHYREEFMAGVMTLEMSDTDKTFKNFAECREHGIRVLPPDVNESRESFTVVMRADVQGPKPIRFGLGAVRGVGAKAVESMIVTREAEGAFTSMADFCRRTQGQQVNRKVVESLVKCGAFDSTGECRERMLAGLDQVLQWAAAEARDAASSQLGLFAAAGGGGGIIDPPRLPEVEAWPDRELLKCEREALGFYITAHPLDAFEKDMRRLTTAPVMALRGRSESGHVSLAGVIQSLRMRNSRKGARYASFVLEDKTGTIEVICWPETFGRCEAELGTDQPVYVSGTLEVGDDRCQVIADEVESLASARERSVQQVHFALRADRVGEAELRTLRDTLVEHQGACQAFLHLLLPEAIETVIELPGGLRVAATEELVDAVERRLGRGVTSFH